VDKFFFFLDHTLQGKVEEALRVLLVSHNKNGPTKVVVPRFQLWEGRPRRAAGQDGFAKKTRRRAIPEEGHS
jgi:hypothetical protein